MHPHELTLATKLVSSHEGHQTYINCLVAFFKLNKANKLFGGKVLDDFEKI
jgi:hypothetical protein